MAELNKNISLQNALNTIKELTINFISEKYCITINEIINYLNFYNLNKKNNLSDNLTENIIFFIEEINTNIFLFDNIFLEDKNSINSTIKLFYNYILNNQIFSFEKNIGYLNKLYNLLFKYKNFNNIDNEKLMNVIEQLKQNKSNEKIEFLNNLKTKIELINNNNNTVLNSNNKQKNDSNFLNKKRISSNNKIEKYFSSSKLKNFKGVKSIIEKEDINKKTIIKTNNNTNLNSDSSFASLSTKCTYNQENIINNEKKSKEKNLKDFSDSNNNNNKIFNNKFFSFNNSNLNSSNSNLSNFLLYNNNNTNSNFSFSSDNTFSGINSKLSTFSFKNLIKSTKKKKKYYNSFNEKIKKKIYDKIKTNENNINNSNKSKENKDIKLKELKNIINSHFYDKKNYIDDLCNLDTAKKEKNINNNINNNNNSLNDMNFIKINGENNYNNEQYNNCNENKYNYENNDEEDDDDNFDIDINKIENKTENNRIEKDILAYKTPNKSKIKNFFMNKENNLEDDKNLLNLLNQK